MLLDENVATSATAELERRGHDAIHVIHTPELGSGTLDQDLVSFATDTDRALVTGDAGFLTPNHRGNTRVLFCRDDDFTAVELGQLLDQLDTYVDTQSELPPVYHLRREDID